MCKPHSRNRLVINTKRKQIGGHRPERLPTNAYAVSPCSFLLRFPLGEFKDQLHQLPLLRRGTAWISLLVFPDKRLPLRLFIQCGQASESRVPLEIIRCLHDHEEPCPQAINLHIQDPYREDHLRYLRTDMLRRVPVAYSDHCSSASIQCLTDTFIRMFKFVFPRR